jgi:serine-type D-Ala-D-Ala carboxypeptidase (penicillin-binding protein 5/6)
MPMPHNRLITYLGISLLAMLAFLSLPKTTSQVTAQKTSEIAGAETITNHFNDISIDAQAALVYDFTTKKILYAKNEHSILPLASLTKIMTAITAADLAPQNTLVTVSSHNLSQVGDSGLLADERWHLKSLLQFMLVISSNDGSAAVASSLGMLAKTKPDQEDIPAFIQKMNEKARALGLTSMHFNNPSGLDENEIDAGGYGSAHDVAMLFEYAMSRYSDIFEPTRYSTFQATSVDDILHTAQNTDVIVHKIPGMIAGKTGFSTLAGGNLAIVFDAGVQRPVAVVVLGSTYDGRFEDVDKLVKASILTITNAK